MLKIGDTLNLKYGILTIEHIAYDGEDVIYLMVKRIDIEGDVTQEKMSALIWNDLCG